MLSRDDPGTIRVDKGSRQQTRVRETPPSKRTASNLGSGERASFEPFAEMGHGL